MAGSDPLSAVTALRKGGRPALGTRGSELDSQEILGALKCCML